MFAQETEREIWPVQSLEILFKQRQNYGSDVIYLRRERMRELLRVNGWRTGIVSIGQQRGLVTNRCKCDLFSGQWLVSHKDTSNVRLCEWASLGVSVGRGLQRCKMTNCICQKCALPFFFSESGFTMYFWWTPSSYSFCPRQVTFCLFQSFYYVPYPAFIHP